MAANRSASATVAAWNAVGVTTSDVTVIPVTRSLYIGVSGDLAVRMSEGSTITFKNVPVGIFPIQVDQVLSTGTNASQIIALY
jgi:hypothetical protein